IFNEKARGGFLRAGFFEHFCDDAAMPVICPTCQIVGNIAKASAMLGYSSKILFANASKQAGEPIFAVLAARCRLIRKIKERRWKGPVWHWLAADDSPQPVGLRRRLIRATRSSDRR